MCRPLQLAIKNDTQHIHFLRCYYRIENFDLDMRLVKPVKNTGGGRQIMVSFGQICESSNKFVAKSVSDCLVLFFSFEQFL
jgi:hypothetical protein